MKNKIALFVCLIGSVWAGLGFASDIKFGLRLTGGMGYTSVGDLNDWRTTRSALIAHDYDSLAEGGIKAIHLGLDGEADVLIYLNDRLALSLGAGFLSVDGGKGRDRISKSPGMDYENLDSSAQAIPLRLGVSYFLLTAKKIQAFLSGGVGYYYAKIRDDIYIVENEGSTWRQTIQEATARGFGLHAGAGLEIKLGSRLALVVEASGRMAKIDDFTGDLDRSFSSGATEKRSGTMYFYGADKGGGRVVKTVEIWSERPTGADKSDIRPFRLDLTGITLRAGIRIHF